MGAVGDNCLSCKHAKMDEVWGEIKCMKWQHYIYSVEKYTPCEYYEKKKTEKGAE